MKDRMKNVGLTVLTVIGIILVLISIYGLLKNLLGDKFTVSAADGLREQTTSQPSGAEKPEADDTPDQISEDLCQPGDNPDIDDAIYKELSRVMNETAFAYRNTENGHKGYAGEHRASFTNRTGVDFETLQLQVSLYQLDDPKQYKGTANIPDEPVEVHDAYIGPLAAGETATLSFTADTEAYNYFLFGYGYSLTEE